jgi:hypothetical protein
MDTGALVAGLAELTGVVRGPERADHELARPDGGDLAADLLDDADVLMAHRRRPLDRFDPAVGPQVRAADTGRRQPDDGVGRFEDRGVVAVFHPDVTGGIQDSSAHEVLLAVDEVWPGGWVPAPGPANLARFTFLNLVGELSTRSDEFRKRWGAHNVRHHGSGAKTYHHPIVGELTLAYEGLEMAAEPGLILSIYTAEPGSPSEEALRLLASWAASQEADPDARTLSAERRRA